MPSPRGSWTAVNTQNPGSTQPEYYLKVYFVYERWLFFFRRKVETRYEWYDAPPPGGTLLDSGVVAGSTPKFFLGSSTLVWDVSSVQFNFFSGPAGSAGFLKT